MQSRIDQEILSDISIKPSKVMLGISGGVDSSVAALLMQKAGSEVIGLTMITNDDGWAAADDAASVCKTLDIQHIVVDVREEFADIIIRNFVLSYTRGRTPNPCISCNPIFKFKLLYSYADKYNCDVVATGHYARVRHLENSRYAMERSPVGFKDQSYFLSRLSQAQLQNLYFPLGNYEKTKVREIAHEHGLVIADGSSIGSKPDSQDNCFIAGSYTEFVQDYLAKNNPELSYLTMPGDIQDEQGRVIGRHRGLISYTIGQRKGFEVKTTERLFVIGRNIENNVITVGSQDKIMRKTIEVSDIVYSGMQSINNAMRLFGRIRHTNKETACTVSPAASGNGNLSVEFDEPVSAPAAGQSCVLYEDNAIMAAGFIEESFS